MSLYPAMPPRRRVKVADPTEHYPTLVIRGGGQQKWHGSGIAVACTHADCRWRMERPLRDGEDPVELFALFHEEVALDA